MINIEKYVEELNIKEIEYYEVNNKSVGEANDVMFLKGDKLLNFKKFIEANEIDTIFYAYFFYNKGYFLVQDDDIDTLQESIYTLFKSDIENHNKKIHEIDFERPIEIVIFCLFNNHKIGVRFDDYWCDDYQLISGEDLLELLIGDYYDEIDEIENKIQEEGEKRLEEFRQFILNDNSFRSCTNKDLRRAYLYRIFNDKSTQKFKELFDYTNEYRPYITSRDFIEMIWREIKNS